MNRRPSVFAHRGSCARAPENTLSAFRLALEERADGVELDVRLSRDDVVVVVHDPDLSRLAKRPESVAHLSAAELRKVDVGGDTIPTLDDVLDLLLPSGVNINIELKGDVPDRWAVVRALAELVHRRTIAERDRLFVSSFRPEMLAALRAIGPDIPVAFLFDRENTGKLRAGMLRRLLRPSGVHPHHSLCNAASVGRWKRRGLFVNAWTVDSPARIAELAAIGVDGIISNQPALALATLGCAHCGEVGESL